MKSLSQNGTNVTNAVGRVDKDAAGEILDNTIIDLKASIIEDLEKEYGSMFGKRSKSLVEILSAARRKLAAAVADDLELPADMDKEDRSVLEQRLKALADLDEEHLRDKGIQWSGLNVKRALAKTSVGRLKGAHRTLGN